MYTVARDAISYSTESIRFGGSRVRAYAIADACFRLQVRTIDRGILELAKYLLYRARG